MCQRDLPSAPATIFFLIPAQVFAAGAAGTDLCVPLGAAPTAPDVPHLVSCEPRRKTIVVETKSSPLSRQTGHASDCRPLPDVPVARGTGGAAGLQIGEDARD